MFRFLADYFDLHKQPGKYKLPISGNMNLSQVGGSAIGSSNAIPIYDGFLNPVSATWNSSTTANTAQTVTTSGYDTVIVTINPSGSITGGALAFEVWDGAQWLAIKAPRIESYSTDLNPTLAGSTVHGWQVPISGFPQFRTRLSTVISGTGSIVIATIVSSAPDTSLVTVGLDPSQPLPAGTNALGSVSLIGSGSFATAQVSVTTSATPLVSARTGAPGTGRIAAVITNYGANTIYVGNSSVTNTTGLPVGASNSISIPTTAAIYGVVSTGTGSIGVFETF